MLGLAAGGSSKIFQNVAVKVSGGAEQFQTKLKYVDLTEKLNAAMFEQHRALVSHTDLSVKAGPSKKSKKLVTNSSDSNLAKRIEAERMAYNQALAARIEAEKALEKLLAKSPEISGLPPKALKSLTMVRYSRYAAYVASGVGTVAMGLDLFLTSIPSAGQSEISFKDLIEFAKSSPDKQCQALVQNPELQDRLNHFLVEEQKSMQKVLNSKINSKDLSIDCDGSSARVNLKADTSAEASTGISSAALSAINFAGPIWRNYSFQYDSAGVVTAYDFRLSTYDLSGQSANKVSILRSVSLDPATKFPKTMKQAGVSRDLTKEKLNDLDKNALVSDYYYVTLLADVSRKVCAEMMGKSESSTGKFGSEKSPKIPASQR